MLVMEFPLVDKRRYFPFHFLGKKTMKTANHCLFSLFLV